MIRKLLAPLTALALMSAAPAAHAGGVVTSPVYTAPGPTIPSTIDEDSAMSADQSAANANDTVDAGEPADDVRFVIIHKPGRAWIAGADIFEQPCIADHARYYKGLATAGRIELGGPFLDKTGGMVVPSAGIDRETADAMAAADPCVAAGVIAYEIKPWYLATNANAR